LAAAPASGQLVPVGDWYANRSRSQSKPALRTVCERVEGSVEAPLLQNAAFDIAGRQRQNTSYRLEYSSHSLHGPQHAARQQVTARLRDRSTEQRCSGPCDVQTPGPRTVPTVRSSSPIRILDGLDTVFLLVVSRPSADQRATAAERRRGLPAAHCSRKPAPCAAAHAGKSLTKFAAERPTARPPEVTADRLASLVGAVFLFPGSVRCAPRHSGRTAS
jgi:hypothetical protein